MANQSLLNIAKIDFVSNLHGTSVWPILLLTHCFSSLVIGRGLVVIGLKNQSKARLFHADFLILVIPCILYVTVLYDELLRKIISIILFVLLFLAIKMSFQPINGSRRFHFITCDITEVKFVCKTILNIVTAICILAVDFNAFPRELAKVEWHGTGLMGVGVGSFVFLNSFSAPSTSHLSSTGKHVYLTSIFLFVIGIVRALSIYIFDYHSHVSEYGVHWNFFLTLTVVHFVLSVFKLIHVNYLLICILVVNCLMQWSFNNGLSDFILNKNERSNIITANIEGIVSLPGFIALAFISKFSSCFFFAKMSGNAVKNQILLTAGMIVVTLICLFAFIEFVEPVCRPTANMGYQLWMVVYNIDMILAVLCNIFLVQYFNTYCTNGDLCYFYGKCVSCVKGLRGNCACVFTAIYRNQLLFFLMANILTGAINISVNTLEVSNFCAVLICIAYLYLICVAMVLKENLFRQCSKPKD